MAKSNIGAFNTLFLLPILVSDSIDTKFIPMYAKLIERHMLFMFHDRIKYAIEDIIHSIEKTMGEGVNITNISLKSNYENLLNLKDDSLNTLKDLNYDDYNDKVLENFNSLLHEKQPAPFSGTKKKGTTDVGSKDRDITSTQSPTGLHLFDTVSIEPTFMVIDVISQKTYNVRKVIISFKAIPYTISNVESVIGIYKYYKSMSGRITRMLFNFTRNYLKTPAKIFSIFKGKYSNYASSSDFFDPGDGKNAFKNIMFGPDYSDIADINKLKMRIKKGTRSTKWVTSVIFSTEDFYRHDLDVNEFFKVYPKLVKMGWGNVIIHDADRDLSLFCSLAYGHCMTMPFTYLRKIMNIDDVLSYEEVSKTRNPFAPRANLNSVVNRFSRNMKK